MDKAELKLMREAWKKRSSQKEMELEKRRSEALNLSKIAARQIIEKYGVQKVILYGSLAWSQHFDHLSDIDLCLVGFSLENNFWRMFSEVEEIVMPFPVSIVLLEEAQKSLADKICKKGVEIV